MEEPLSYKLYFEDLQHSFYATKNATTQNTARLTTVSSEHTPEAIAASSSVLPMLEAR